MITGYVCRHCGARNIFEEDFDYASYKDGMRIVSEITRIYPTNFKEREEILAEASRTVRILLDEHDRILVRDAVARISEDLGMDNDTANDALLEVLVELGRKAFLERDATGLWLKRTV